MQIKYDKELLKKYGPPKYETDGAAAIDLRSNNLKRITLMPGHAALIGTGLHVDLSGASEVGLVLPRGGLGSKGLVLNNMTGVIDSDYQGEILLSVINRSPNQETFEINYGDRIMQMIFAPVIQKEFEVVDEFKTATKRGEGRFTSTGKQ